MTAPVMDTMGVSENITMTAPLMDTLSNSGKHIVAFTMPSIYTLENLPEPDNANIRFRVVENTRRAVLRYTGYATEARVDAKKQSLME
jgi:SOUL heme-binding protein